MGCGWVVRQEAVRPIHFGAHNIWNGRKGDWNPPWAEYPRRTWTWEFSRKLRS